MHAAGMQPPQQHPARSRVIGSLIRNGSSRTLQNLPDDLCKLLSWSWDSKSLAFSATPSGTVVQAWPTVWAEAEDLGELRMGSVAGVLSLSNQRRSGFYPTAEPTGFEPVQIRFPRPRLTPPVNVVSVGSTRTTEACFIHADCSVSLTIGTTVARWAIRYTSTAIRSSCCAGRGDRLGHHPSPPSRISTHRISSIALSGV